MKHLNTQELLLHCDGELKQERAAHLRLCVPCQTQLVDLQAALYEIEHRLRNTIPAAPERQRELSRVRLERALYPVQPVASFPLRWPAVYAVAASLAIAVFSGYMTARLPTDEDLSVLASLESSRPDAAVAAPEQQQPADVLVAASNTPAQARRANLAPSAPERTLAALAAESTTAAPAARFEWADWNLASPRPPYPQPVLRRTGGQAEPVVRASLPSYLPLFTAPGPARVPRPFSAELSLSTPLTTPLSRRERIAAIVEGRAILMRAGLWQEDIQPIAAPSNIRFRGTAENKAAVGKFTASIRKAAGEREVAIELRPRDVFGSGNVVSRLALLGAAGDSRPLGGAVRNSLLSHFGDAARRSFQSPEPAVLESELERYVTEVFRNETRLLAHVHALYTLLDEVGAAAADEFDVNTKRQVRELAGFHLDAIAQRQARIYDRLSEALPRRYWAYRAARDAADGGLSRQQQSRRLLRESLELDATLTALLATPQATVDAAESNLSGGELLRRIQISARRLAAHIQAFE